VILVYELLSRVTYCLYKYFVDFACRVQASQLVEHVWASSPPFNITMPEAEVMNSPSSDTEEALDLLFLSLAHGPLSPASNPRSGSDSDIFEDWPEVNDMAASVYVALTADASSSRASTVDACATFKSHVPAACLADFLIRRRLHPRNLGDGKLR
jgi:hypothetical protein